MIESTDTQDKVISMSTHSTVPAPRACFAALTRGQLRQQGGTGLFVRDIAKNKEYATWSG
jgi:hypothetical protein